MHEPEPEGWSFSTEAAKVPTTFGSWLGCLLLLTVPCATVVAVVWLVTR